MAISTTIVGIPETAPVRAHSGSGSRTIVRRRISPQAGRALEVLGHAIDYMTDEHIHRGGRFNPGDPEVHAIQLLAAANRAIYFECPEVPGLGERFLRLLGIGRL